jgi:hypothetical protein
MDKNVVASAGIVIGILVLAASFHTGLMIGPRYKLENRRDRERSNSSDSSGSSSSSGSSGYYSPENGGGRRKTKRSKRT